MKLGGLTRHGMRHGMSIALVVSAAALGIYAWSDRESVTEAEQKARENNVFDAWRREDVTRVELVQGTETIVLERDGKGEAGSERAWHMTSPRVDESDAASVDRLLQHLELATAMRRMEGDAGSVESARVRGSIRMGALTYTFALGGPAPRPEGASYLRVEGGAHGSRTLVVSRDLTTELLKTADRYRVRTIVPYLSIDLAKLEVKGKTNAFSLERIDATSFRLLEPNVRASRDKLDDVWRALAEMRAELFITDAEAMAAVASPVFTITMSPKDSARPRGELIVGGPCPDQPESVVVVRTSPTRLAACAPKGILPGLGTTHESLIDRRLFAAHEDEVAELKIEAVPGSGPGLELARKGNGWHLRAPSDRELAGDEVDAANVLAASLARGTGEVVAKDYFDGLRAVPRGRVTISRGDGQGEEVVELSVVPENGAFVRRRADGATLRIGRDLARKLVPRAIALHGHHVWTPSIEGAPISAVRTQCGAITQALTHAGGAWSLHVTAPGMPPNAPYQPDIAGTLDLTDAVTRAKTEAWIADEDDGTFGFDHDACSITLSILQDGGTRTVGLVFGTEGEGGTYVHALGERPVFLMPPAMRKLAEILLVDTHSIGADPAAIRSVTLTRAGKSKVITPEHSTGGGGGGGGGGGVEAIATALGQLRADAAIHLGAALPAEGFQTPTLDVSVITASDAGSTTTRFTVGASTMIGPTKMYFARIPGVQATFVISEARLKPLLDAM